MLGLFDFGQNHEAEGSALDLRSSDLNVFFLQDVDCFLLLQVFIEVDGLVEGLLSNDYDFVVLVESVSDQSPPPSHSADLRPNGEALFLLNHLFLIKEVAEVLLGNEILQSLVLDLEATMPD